MDFQKLIDDMNDYQKLKSGLEYNLGDFINDLENIDKEKGSETIIQVEDGVYPDSFHSWRGSYCELALDYGDKPISVGELLKKAKECNGKTFIGYKGGDFTMDLNTPIHLERYGEVGYYGKLQPNETEDYNYAKIVCIGEQNGKFYIGYRDDNY